MGSKVCSRIIEYSFYALFLLVPLVLTSATSELFELNKMWLTWGLTIIIGACWLIRMILEKRILFQRTPLDIPIVLFLISQIISTIFSMDPHVSLWGYYSRFNGGLLSLVSYIFLYYAFLSNFRAGKIEAADSKAHLPTAALADIAPRAEQMVKRILAVSLLSGLIVALWGLPSHFGYDPTCLVFRGTFDVSCWTTDFYPTVRIFSTMGQPDWLAAYLAVLIPIAIIYAVFNWKKFAGSWLKNWKLWSSIALVILFYVDLLYTRARSGFLGIWTSLVVLCALYCLITLKSLRSSVKTKLKDPIALLIVGLLIITFIIGNPIGQLKIFSIEGIGERLQNMQAAKTVSKVASPSANTVAPRPGGGTSSEKIRLYVWTGALNAWKDNPVFGTGVETFAFAYYKYKPVGQNLTSEWDFLYNKAHNEYLNYLATTGMVGLGTYLAMIIAFLVIFTRYFVSNVKKGARDARILLSVALIASYISILITNFFGFSVVIMNIYLFIIPAFIFILTDKLKTGTVQAQSTNKSSKIETDISAWQWTSIALIVIIGFFMLYSLARFWQADTAYALGMGQNAIGDYQQAYVNFHKAVELRSDEPVFKNELAVNNALLAAALIAQNKNSENEEQALNAASTLTQEAINTINEIVFYDPNNVVFWKTRTRIFSILSQIDSRYLSKTLESIKKASALAPNDARIMYNLGVLYGQNNEVEKGIEILKRSIELRPYYQEAYYALGLFYHQLAIDKNGKVIDAAMQQQAVEQMQYILDNISPENEAASSAIEEWSK